MNVWKLNIRQLRSFCAVCQLGSVVAASRQVNLSQPAVTQGIHRLEEQLNLTLFVRETSGMKPTSSALVLLPRVSAALNHISSNKVTSAQARALIEVSRRGSFSEASVSIGLASATLHRAVSDLETALSRKLITRRGRGIELTKHGRLIARNFRLAEAELLAGLEELKTEKGQQEGSISVGAMPLCRARLLPAAIVSFQATAPDVSISIAEGSYIELIDPLRDGELDFLVGALRDPALLPDVKQTPLFTDKPVIVARRGHPLAQSNTLPWIEELARFPWVIPAKGVPLRDLWETLFEKHELPAVPVECGSVIAIRQILMSTDYLTILSRDQIKVELEAGWLAVIGETPPGLSRTIGIYTRNDWRPTEIQQAFIDQLSSNA